MSTELYKIVDFFVVHVSTAGNSSRMEKKGLQTLLEKYSDLIKITTLTTDRHVQIRSFLSREYPEILHQFGVWHFGKSLKKLYLKLRKKRDCHQVSLWIKAIINHLWWCCASSIGNEKLIREKWLSMLNHIRGIHSWEDNKLFHKCEHGQMDRERKWLKTDSPSLLALKNVVENKKILAEIKYLSKFCHTGSLEVFHSVINKYCPKRLQFTLEGMIARTQLAVLDYNCGNIQATSHNKIQATFKPQQKMGSADTNKFFLK